MLSIWLLCKFSSFTFFFFAAAATEYKMEEWNHGNVKTCFIFAIKIDNYEKNLILKLYNWRLETVRYISSF